MEQTLIGALLAVIMFFVLIAKNKLIDAPTIRNLYIVLVVLSVIYLIYDKFQDPSIKFSFILLVLLLAMVNAYKIFFKKYTV